MPGQSPQREPAAGKAPTGQRTVHCDLRCLSCEFVVADRRVSLQKAREHNQATGHDLEGDRCCFMPAGSKAARKPEQQLRETLPFLSEP